MAASLDTFKLPKSQALEFVINTLKIENISDILAEIADERSALDKENRNIDLLNKIVRRWHEIIPCHNLTQLARDPLDRVIPDVSQCVADVMSGVGGSHWCNNISLYYVLKSLQFDVHIIMGYAHGNKKIYNTEDAFTCSRALVLVENLVNLGDQYVIDVGSGYACFDIIPLNFEHTSQCYTTSLATFRYTYIAREIISRQYFINDSSTYSEQDAVSTQGNKENIDHSYTSIDCHDEKAGTNREYPNIKECSISQQSENESSLTVRKSNPLSSIENENVILFRPNINQTQNIEDSNDAQSQDGLLNLQVESVSIMEQNDSEASALPVDGSHFISIMGDEIDSMLQHSDGDHELIKQASGLSSLILDDENNIPFELDDFASSNLGENFALHQNECDFQDKEKLSNGSVNRINDNTTDKYLTVLDDVQAGITFPSDEIPLEENASSLGHNKSLFSQKDESNGQGYNRSFQTKQNVLTSDTSEEQVIQKDNSISNIKPMDMFLAEENCAIGKENNIPLIEKENVSLTQKDRCNNASFNKTKDPNCISSTTGTNDLSLEQGGQEINSLFVHENCNSIVLKSDEKVSINQNKNKILLEKVNTNGDLSQQSHLEKPVAFLRKNEKPKYGVTLAQVQKSEDSFPGFKNHEDSLTEEENKDENVSVEQKESFISSNESNEMPAQNDENNRELNNEPKWIFQSYIWVKKKSLEFAQTQVDHFMYRDLSSNFNNHLNVLKYKAGKIVAFKQNTLLLEDEITSKCTLYTFDKAVHLVDAIKKHFPEIPLDVIQRAVANARGQ